MSVDIVVCFAAEVKEALDNCLDQIAQEFDLGVLDKAKQISRIIAANNNSDVVPDDAEDLYNHVSIRFNVAEEEPDQKEKETI